MANDRIAAPTPTNEPVLGYLPGSPERASLEAELNRMRGETIEIPLIIDGKEVRTGNTKDAVFPVPVWAMPRTSRPVTATGMAPA